MGILKKIKNNKVLFIILISLTLFRIMIALKIPLQLQADAMYDDFLFVKYAKSLLSFEWLGSFSYLTFAKGISFSIFLCVNYIIGIPYALALILTYIFSIVVFVYTIRKLIKNKYFLSVLYLFLLFSPVMLHVENVQKVYRGGVLISFVLLVISGIIGLYLNINENNKKKIFYTILLSICLPFFWFLKEDSIWILPFLVVGSILTIVKVFKDKTNKKKKIIITILPIIVLVFVNIGYKTINYIKYGEFAITDRSETYYKEVISDLIHIDGKGRNKDYWITKDMINKAYDNSSTFSSMKEALDNRYEIWADENGEIHGDIVFWVIKEAANDIGVYSKTGKEASEFYEKIHQELQEAYKKGSLKKNKDFYVLNVVKGITSDEIPEYLNFVNDSKKALITQSEFSVGLFPSSGNEESLAFFKELTMAKTVDKDVDPTIYKLSNYFVKICNFIKDVYSKTGYILYYSMLVVLLGMICKFIYNIIKKNKDERFNSIFLISIGLLLTCVAQFIGTTFFARFLSIRKIYDYTSVIYPLLQIVELISIYMLVSYIRNKVVKK